MAAILIAVPMIFNAVELWPEVAVPVPSLNDDASHYLLIQRASEALARGENLVDHWVPELELGFPQFFYYQHLPHVAVVLLHRLLLGWVDLFTLFNLTRYVLLVGFPLTVYWSMRRMGFSVVAGAVAAAASTLIHQPGYGIEYNSYVWRGLGMYTQIWAIHLALITLACLYSLLERGQGYVAAVIACTALGLSHLMYAYIVAVAAVVMVLAGLTRANLRPRLIRFALVGGLSLLIASYLIVPLLGLKGYVNVSVYLQRWKYDSLGAATILERLVDGDLLDQGRLPVLTVLLALGLAAAILSRSRPARVTLAFFAVMVLFAFGRATWGGLVDLLPLGADVHYLRFLGGVHLAALILIGLGGAWLWEQGAALPERWRALAFGVVLLALLTPAMRELHVYYTVNGLLMKETKQTIDTNADAAAVIAAIRKQPPARTYAGLRDNWGSDPRMRFGPLRFTDLLTFHRIVAASPPYQGVSLTSDLVWHFDDRNPKHYDLFNVRYVVAPTGLPVADFLRPIMSTARYTLYQAPTSGYAQFGALTRLARVRLQSRLFFLNRNWMLKDEMPARKFTRYEYPAAKEGSTRLTIPDCPEGTVADERVEPARLDLTATCPHVSTLVVKVPYQPNWRVTVDGAPVETFMVTPGFLGIAWPAGAHRVSVEYRSPRLKIALLLLGGCVLAATLVFGRRLERLEAALSSAIGRWWPARRS